MYDEYYNCVICPEYKVLNCRATNRERCREYRSDPSKCAECPTRDKCTNSKGSVKTVQRHIWKCYEELAEDARHTPKYRELYLVKLKITAMNIKKLTIRWWRDKSGPGSIPNSV